MLTAKTLDDLIDQVERQHKPPEPKLILPAWFPEDQFEFADEWAKQHGWTGALRG